MMEIWPVETDVVVHVLQKLANQLFVRVSPWHHPLRSSIHQSIILVLPPMRQDQQHTISQKMMFQLVLFLLILYNLALQVPILSSVSSMETHQHRQHVSKQLLSRAHRYLLSQVFSSIKMTLLQGHLIRMEMIFRRSKTMVLPLSQCDLSTMVMRHSKMW